jgi:hypothetical protein
MEQISHHYTCNIRQTTKYIAEKCGQGNVNEKQKIILNSSTKNMKFISNQQLSLIYRNMLNNYMNVGNI